jgi:hypothetical protein
LIYAVSENSRALFGKLAFYGITLANITRLFESQGFELPTDLEPADSRESRVRQYQEQVDWSDLGQVRRVLQVYRAAIDEYGRPFAGRLTPQAKNLLKSLERDGNLVSEGEILIFEPEFDLEGPLGGLIGWDQIDHELTGLRRDFARAAEPHDHQALALRCLSILRLLSDQLYDPSCPPVGEDVPGPADVKARIDQFVRNIAAGDRFEHVRKLVRDAYAQANAVKHRRVPDRVDSGVAVAATILLAEMLRLISHRTDELGRHGAPVSRADHQGPWD